MFKMEKRFKAFLCALNKHVRRHLVFVAFATYVSAVATLSYLKLVDFEDLIESTLIGISPSFIFYLLVVYIPNMNRTRIIVDGFIKQYRILKCEIIETILRTINIHLQSSELECLLDPVSFGKYMKVDTGDRQDRHDRFLNQMDETSIKAILSCFMQIERQISSVLLSLEIDDQDFYNFLNRLQLITFNLELEKNYDFDRAISGLITDLFYGYNIITGKRSDNVDLIERAFLNAKHIL